MSKTQLEAARAGEVTPEMEYVARAELPGTGIGATGSGRGPHGHSRQQGPPRRPTCSRMGIGIAARCKINANIGNSAVTSDAAIELEKLHTAVHFGADTVMDLSTGKDIDRIRQAIIDTSPVPIGTVPIYQMLEELGGDIEDMKPQHFLDMVEHQAKQGVDYMTVHCGVLLEHLQLTTNRVTGIVSRGGSLDRQVDDGPPPAEPAVHALRRSVRDHAAVRRDLEPGRRHASRLDRRCQRRGPVRRTGGAGGTGPARLGGGHAGAWSKGPGTSRWTRSR